MVQRLFEQQQKEQAGSAPEGMMHSNEAEPESGRLQPEQTRHLESMVQEQGLVQLYPQYTKKILEARSAGYLDMEIEAFVVGGVSAKPEMMFPQFKDKVLTARENKYTDEEIYETILKNDPDMQSSYRRIKWFQEKTGISTMSAALYGKVHLAERAVRKRLGEEYGEIAELENAWSESWKRSVFGTLTEFADTQIVQPVKNTMYMAEAIGKAWDKIVLQERAEGIRGAAGVKGSEAVKKAVRNEVVFKKTVANFISSPYRKLEALTYGLTEGQEKVLQEQTADKLVDTYEQGKQSLDVAGDFVWEFSKGGAKSLLDMTFKAFAIIRSAAIVTGESLGRVYKGDVNGIVQSYWDIITLQKERSFGEYLGSAGIALDIVFDCLTPGFFMKFPKSGGKIAGRLKGDKKAAAAYLDLYDNYKAGLKGSSQPAKKVVLYGRELKNHWEVFDNTVNEGKRFYKLLKKSDDTSDLVAAILRGNAEGQARGVAVFGENILDWGSKKVCGRDIPLLDIMDDIGEGLSNYNIQANIIMNDKLADGVAWAKKVREAFPDDSAFGKLSRIIETGCFKIIETTKKIKKTIFDDVFPGDKFDNVKDIFDSDLDTHLFMINAQKMTAMLDKAEETGLVSAIQESRTWTQSLQAVDMQHRQTLNSMAGLVNRMFRRFDMDELLSEDMENIAYIVERFGGAYAETGAIKFKELASIKLKLDKFAAIEENVMHKMVTRVTPIVNKSEQLLNTRLKTTLNFKLRKAEDLFEAGRLSLPGKTLADIKKIVDASRIHTKGLPEDVVKGSVIMRKAAKEIKTAYVKFKKDTATLQKTVQDMKKSSELAGKGIFDLEGLTGIRKTLTKTSMESSLRFTKHTDEGAAALDELLGVRKTLLDEVKRLISDYEEYDEIYDFTGTMDIKKIIGEPGRLKAIQDKIYRWGVLPDWDNLKAVEREVIELGAGGKSSYIKAQAAQRMMNKLYSRRATRGMVSPLPDYYHRVLDSKLKDEIFLNKHGRSLQRMLRKRASIDVLDTASNRKLKWTVIEFNDSELDVIRAGNPVLADLAQGHGDLLMPGKLHLFNSDDLIQYVKMNPDLEGMSMNKVLKYMKQEIGNIFNNDGDLLTKMRRNATIREVNTLGKDGKLFKNFDEVKELPFDATLYTGNVYNTHFEEVLPDLIDDYAKFQAMDSLATVMKPLGTIKPDKIHNMTISGFFNRYLGKNQKTGDPLTMTSKILESPNLFGKRYYPQQLLEDAFVSIQALNPEVMLQLGMRPYNYWGDKQTGQCILDGFIWANGLSNTALRNSLPMDPFYFGMNKLEEMNKGLMLGARDWDTYSKSHRILAHHLKNVAEAGKYRSREQAAGVSQVFGNLFGGTKAKDIAIKTIFGKNIYGNQITRMAEKWFIIGNTRSTTETYANVQNYIAKSGKARKHVSTRFTDVFRELFAAQGTKFGTNMRAVGMVGEDIERLATFTNRLKMGYSEQAAAKFTWMVHFDWGAAGKDARTFARTIMPFFNFFRNNFRFYANIARQRPDLIRIIPNLSNALTYWTYETRHKTYQKYLDDKAGGDIYHRHLGPLASNPDIRFDPTRFTGVHDFANILNTLLAVPASIAIWVGDQISGEKRKKADQDVSGFTGQQRILTELTSKLGPGLSVPLEVLFTGRLRGHDEVTALNILTKMFIKHPAGRFARYIMQGDSKWMQATKLFKVKTSEKSKRKARKKGKGILDWVLGVFQ